MGSSQLSFRPSLLLLLCALPVSLFGEVFRSPPVRYRGVRARAGKGRVPVGGRGGRASGFVGRTRRRGNFDRIRREEPTRMEHLPLTSNVAEEEGPWGTPFVEARFLEGLRRRSITTPSPVQMSSTAKIWNGHSVVVQASTGSGKTLAYLLPLLSKLVEEKRGVRKSQETATRGLILTPSPELCVQTASEIEFLAGSLAGGEEEGEMRNDERGLSCRMMTSVGRLEDQLTDIESSPPDVIVGMPKQVATAMKSQRGKALFKGISWVVVDEADRVLKPLSKYASQRERRSRSLHLNPTEGVVNGLLGLNRHLQIVLLSATVNSPLRSLFGRNGWRIDRILSGKPFEIPPQIRHHWVVREKEMKLTDTIQAIVERRKLERGGGETGGCMVFVIDFLDLATFKNALLSRGMQVEILHEVAQHDIAARKELLAKMSSGELDVVIATEANSRGLDIPGLDLVILTAPCQEPNSYIHLAGRTGRQGQKGEVWTLAYEKEDIENVGKLMSYLSLDFEEIPQLDLMQFLPSDQP